MTCMSVVKLVQGMWCCLVSMPECTQPDPTQPDRRLEVHFRLFEGICVLSKTLCRVIKTDSELTRGCHINLSVYYVVPLWSQHQNNPWTNSIFLNLWNTFDVSRQNSSPDFLLNFFFTKTHACTKTKAFWVASVVVSCPWTTVVCPVVANVKRISAHLNHVLPSYSILNVFVKGTMCQRKHGNTAASVRRSRSLCRYKSLRLGFYYQ